MCRPGRQADGADHASTSSTPPARPSMRWFQTFEAGNIVQAGAPGIAGPGAGVGVGRVSGSRPASVWGRGSGSGPGSASAPASASAQHRPGGSLRSAGRSWRGTRRHRSSRRCPCRRSADGSRGSARSGCSGRRCRGSRTRRPDRRRRCRPGVATSRRRTRSASAGRPCPGPPGRPAGRRRSVSARRGFSPASHSIRLVSVSSIGVLDGVGQAVAVGVGLQRARPRGGLLPVVRQAVAVGVGRRGDADRADQTGDDEDGCGGDPVLAATEAIRASPHRGSRASDGNASVVPDRQRPWSGSGVQQVVH